MSNFAKNFFKVLNEQDNLPPLGSDVERDAMEASLDDGTDASEFDTDLTPNPAGTPEDDISNAFAAQNQKMVSTIQSWITQTEQFLSFLNGEEPTSIQSTLAAATPETVMDKMKQSQQSKISRVASDLASFHQSLLGFMAQTKNSKFKYQ